MEIRKPVRATRTFVQKLVAPPERVFPLLCPVLEAEWLDGWDPIVVFHRLGCRRTRVRFHDEGRAPSGHLVRDPA